ncbi:VOC family protein [Curtobacterium sp. Leaf261]|uniref:VOC family protein n=1 Tax=Curtobacterium sp. Leaf261 TaxID=1736311 RepID=UPI0007010DF3|nr:VOC family protein [Curtobacterium sp. Leaf261]KQO63112.1 3-demethylubiquinone-9 3-methyltransferase [Curtobacterium sp. Leaf261]
MPTTLNPYLGFRDTARTALEFYHSVFGGELTLSTFGDLHASEDPAEQDKIMHGQLRTAGGLVLMASDTPSGMGLREGSSISVSLSGEDEPELRRYWDGLSAGATIIEPLTAAPWGDQFGMLTDTHGVTWLVNITQSAA